MQSQLPNLNVKSVEDLSRRLNDDLTRIYTDLSTSLFMPAWKDELGDALSIQKSGVGITLDIAELTVNFDHNALYHATPASADFLYKNTQLNHDKDLEASIYPHIHWMQSKNYSPNFLIGYRWQKNGSAKTTDWTLIACNTLAFTYVSGTLNQISYSSPISAPAGASLSDIVQFRVYRDTSGASSVYTGVTCPYNTGGNASAPVTAFDIHFQIDNQGSKLEYEK